MNERYERLVQEHKDAVYRQMVRVCGNHDDAEDVLVEALLRAYQALDSLEDETAFRGWLAIIGRRVCGRLRKKEALAPLVALADAERIPVPPDDLADHGDMASLKARLHQALDELPEEMRQVYMLRDIEEVSGEETADRLGITLAAMKSRLHRARALVREKMDVCIECQTQD
jgi:RNA polymerase sigma-70 factor (ECF subfamily)